MSKNTDSVWSLIGGVFLGSTVVAVLWFFDARIQPQVLHSPPESAITQTESPVLIETETAPSAEAIAEFNSAVDAYAAIASTLFGTDAVNQGDSTLSKRATEILDSFVAAGDPIGHHPSATLVIYSMAAADLGRTAVAADTLRTAWEEDQKQRDAQWHALETDRDTWKNQAQSAISAAEYNRLQAAQTAANAAAAAAAYQQQQAAAQAQIAALNARPTYTPPPTRPLSARESFERMQRRYPLPSQPIEIDPLSGLGSDGLPYNVERLPGGLIGIQRIGQ